MNIDLKDAFCFGVAGNFTGHLEQAGEAVDFKNVVTEEECAPKALFPTFIKSKNKEVPEYLKVFPFDSEKIIFPKDEEKLQIEPECALVFEAFWQDGLLKDLKALAFTASNDCSIRKQGAKKISEKKNWGESSKGYSKDFIQIEDFSKNAIIDSYRIASFLVRDKKVFDYGEDSAVRDYSYVYEKLKNWIIDKINNQKDEGPAENLSSYLKGNEPEKIFVSIGATRYTEFGENNFLKAQDEVFVILYPEGKYSHSDIINFVKESIFPKDLSVLKQKVLL